MFSSDQHIQTLAQLFRNYFQYLPTSVVQLKGDASARTLYRMQHRNQSVIGVYGPDVYENRAFIGFTKSFLQCGFPVPQIYTVSKNELYYLEEDLGDVTLYNLVQQVKPSIYTHPDPQYLRRHYVDAIEYLIQFQTELVHWINWELCYQTKVFDETAWETDINNFLFYFIKSFYTSDDNECEAMKKELILLYSYLRKNSLEYFLYRDFQSRNIMVTGKGLYFIDYQSARKGALPYDLAALLYDARANLSNDFREELKDFYTDKISSKIAQSEWKKIKESFPFYAIIRILQALGSYGRNAKIHKKKEYLESVPFALANLVSILQKHSYQTLFPILWKFVQNGFTPLHRLEKEI
ncbi:MAG: phosphotransferase [bacterium]|nr:phosphotransferase [bacterium]